MLPKQNVQGTIESRVLSDRQVTTCNVHCENCNQNYCHTPPKTFTPFRENKFRELNIQDVYHTLVSREGCTVMKQRASFLCTSPMCAASYIRHWRYLHSLMDEHCSCSMAAAHEAVRKYYISRGIAHPNKDGIINTEVTFDGTWMTRGHKSHTGTGFLVKVNTGIKVEFEVLCSFCIVCHRGKFHHQRCHKNFDGRSGAMEAEKQWGCRGTPWITSSFTVQINWWWWQVPTLQCVSWTVVKACFEMHQWSRKNVSTTLARGWGHDWRKWSRRQVSLWKPGSRVYSKSLLGGQRKLMEAIINCSKAISKNKGDTMFLYKAIWSIYFRLLATDKQPSHQLCPDGQDYWCFIREHQEWNASNTCIK